MCVFLVQDIVSVCECVCVCVCVCESVCVCVVWCFGAAAARLGLQAPPAKDPGGAAARALQACWV